MNNAERQALLLQELLAGQTAAPEPATVPDPPSATTVSRTVGVPAAQPKPRGATSTGPGLYNQLGQSVAFMTSLAIAASLWFAGAYFTLAAIAPDTARTLAGGQALAWWLLPMGITGVEIWLMPRTGVRALGLITFALVLAVDISTSWYGVIDVVGGQFFKMGPGFTAPTGGPWLHAFAVVSALVLAFIPEKLARWAWAELLNVWR